MIKDEVLDTFEKVCIDTEEIRDAISNSTTIKVVHVPCFLQLRPDGTVATYEADDAFKLASQLMSQKVPTSSAGGLPVSSVDKILGGLESLNRSGPAHSQAPPMRGSQSRHDGELDLSRAQHDIGAMKRGPRRTPFQGITSERDVMDDTRMAAPDRPVRGEGHESMRSSLSGMGVQENEPYDAIEPITTGRTVTVGRGGQAVVVQDLTPDDDGPDLDDDPSGMGKGTLDRGEVPIRGPAPAGANLPSKQSQRPAQMGGRGKDKNASIKLMAAAMAAARKTEMEDHETDRQEPQQPQRQQAKNARRTAVSMA